MLALQKVAKGVGNIELRDVPEPDADPGWVKIEVKAAAVCGTDIHIRHDQFPYWPPVTLGHEFSGVITELGEGVTGWEVGDRVVAEPHTLACGECWLCRQGHVQICAEKRSPGWGIDGAFAKYLVMESKLLHALPDSVSFDAGALVEPTANTVHDVGERAKVEPEDFVVVLGPGPIGLLAAQVAKGAGAREVMIIGTPADADLRLPTAEKLGIDHVVNLAEQDPIEMCMELTGGRGADLVVECSGAAPAINSAVELVRKKGRICVIGMTGRDDIQFTWDAAIFKGIDVFFNISTSYSSWDRSISMIEKGKVDAEAIVTHREPLENWEEVFDALEAQEGLKALFIPE
jgi:L-iditol 2-dehydrogenase